MPDSPYSTGTGTDAPRSPDSTSTSSSSRETSTEAVAPWREVEGERAEGQLQQSAGSPHEAFGHESPETGDTFANQLPERLDEELAKAHELGVEPARPGTPQFDDMIQDGSIKYAVNPDGELMAVPKFAQGEEVSHSVIFEGKPVVSAGEANIAGSSDAGYYGLDITNQSGHYRPSEASLDVARDAFQRHGIVFP